jgi:hypothetical protein
MLVVTLLVVAAVSMPLALLTALGASQRGCTLPLSVLAGLFYPATWTLWYIEDEHPYRRNRRAI